MNFEPRHRRVAVRQELIPKLEASRPGFGDLVLAVADDARRVDAAASSAASATLARAYREPGAFVVPATELRNAGAFARARLLRRVTEEDPSFGHATWSLLDALGRASAAGARVAEEVRRGVRLTAVGGLVALFVNPRTSSGSFTWDGNGVVQPIDAVRSLRIEPLADRAPVPGGFVLALDPGARVEVRPRRATDRFPLGGAGHKLVADEFSDRKVQPVWRSRIPLVFVDGQLAWIPGLRVIRRTDRPPNVVMRVEGPTPWAP
jgi:tRNA(Ile)-lysidine synthetase-like protein